MDVFSHSLDLFHHGFLLVLEVANAVVVVFVFSFEATLASAAVDEVFFALRVNVDLEILLGKLLFAMLACHFGCGAVRQVLSQPVLRE